MIQSFNFNAISQPNLSNWWKGEDYHHHSHSQYKLAEEVLLKHPFKGDEKILDIGCGDGEITRFIAREKVPFGSVVGMDASSSMLKSALANNKQSNATFQKGRAESFQIDDLFDVIVSFSALHWVPDQPAVWNNIRKHLKIEGHALISLNPQPRNQELSEAIDEVIQHAKFYSFFRDFVEESLMPLLSTKEYEEIILHAGLRVDECTQSFKYFDYKDKKVFVNNVKAWLPHVGQIPEHLQDVFVELIITKFLIKTNQPDRENIKLKYNHFMIQATRLN